MDKEPHVEIFLLATVDTLQAMSLLLYFFPTIKSVLPNNFVTVAPLGLEKGCLLLRYPRLRSNIDVLLILEYVQIVKLA